MKIKKIIIVLLLCFLPIASFAQKVERDIACLGGRIYGYTSH